ncbi:flagellar type III secretion system pore protein FliP, partial [Campylobacter jejuni]
YEEAFIKGAKPFKDFMLKNTREKDLALFYRIRNLPNPKTIDDVPLTVLVPAFMISELKTAFEIGFLIYLPFLVIDMVVSSVLMAMGMMMLPPTMISLPFKLLIFVLVDGWNLLVQRLVESFVT